HAVRLRFEPLEGRAVPTGNVTASLIGGRLTITGDDQDNALTLLVTATEATVASADGTTTVNGQAAVTLPGAATSLSANLHGGDDTLAIDPNSDFVLTGAAAINLGDGTNTLNLTTTGRLSLGSLAVTSGPGSNLVTLNPAAGGTVTGPASFAFGPGGS